MSGTIGNTPQLDITKLVFHGLDGNECEDFIAYVRHFAFFKGKGHDDGWKLNFATSCLRGKALRWHAELDATVQKDWDLFVRAPLKRYPPITTVTPIPAAALSNRVAVASTPWATRAGPQDGHLRLTGPGFPGSDWVGKSTDYETADFGGVRSCYVQAQLSGVIVRFLSGPQRHGIYIKASTFSKQNSWLDRLQDGLVSRGTPSRATGS